MERKWLTASLIQAGHAAACAKNSKKIIYIKIFVEINFIRCMMISMEKSKRCNGYRSLDRPATPPSLQGTRT